MLRVNEVFYSVQGEGYWTGTPAVFIRLQGCKVGCRFCDTKHTWVAAEAFQTDRATILQDLPRRSPGLGRSWAEITIQELVNWVRLNSHPTAIVVVTGGEPLEQAETFELVTALRESGRQVQIETSGTQDFSRYVATDYHENNPWVTVSPKFESSVPVLEHLLPSAHELKVVVSNPAMVATTRRLLESGKFSLGRFRVQPETGPNFRWSAAECVSLCKEFGCKLSLQTHTFLAVR